VREAFEALRLKRSRCHRWSGRALDRDGDREQANTQAYGCGASGREALEACGSPAAPGRAAILDFIACGLRRRPSLEEAIDRPQDRIVVTGGRGFLGRH